MDLCGEKVVVCDAGGHLVKKLLEDGVDVVRRAVDIKPLDGRYQASPGVENLSLDLKNR
jgi:hypothetical protein